MRNVIAWMAMLLGIVSLVTVLHAGDPNKALAVNPMFALHLPR
jgi:hypothetical protein